MITQLRRAKDRVEFLLSKHPVCRDDDKLLWIAYLVTFHDLKLAIGNDAYEKFKKILLDEDTCSMESVRRVRQKFQEEGSFIGKKRQAKLDEAERVASMMRSQ